MKYLLNIILLLAIAGCDEVFITPIDQNPPTVNNPKLMVVEKFTAVDCPNCPRATELLKNLADEHPGKIITVAIYGNLAGFGFEIDPNDPDLNFSSAEVLGEYLGDVTALPSAAINRTAYETGSLVMTDRSKWPTYKNSELAKSSPAKLNVSNLYDSGTGELEISVEVEMVADVENPVFISVYLTENDIVADQYMPDGSTDIDYNHKHVLRAIVTELTGDAVSESTLEGDTFTKSASYTIPSEWNAENMEIVAFIHNGAGANREILQSTVEKLKL